MATVDNELLTEREAAAILAVKPATLNTWRCLGRHDLPFVRVGRAIRYRRADVLAFIEANTVTPERASI